MEMDSPSSSDEPPHPFDFQTLSINESDLYPYPTIELPLTSPEIPHVPITTTLFPTDTEISMQTDVEQYIQQFFVYCHFAQTL